jgi:RNA 2',3'-cyclic 3'-phosphodiesterase
VRLFVGLVPSSAALDDLDGACAPFRLARDDLRWTGRELWHLTLAFLGEVSEESLPRLLPWLERAAGRNRSCTLSVAGPHLTLARCRAPVDVREIVARLDRYQGPGWTVEEIYLIRSTLNGRPRYEMLETWKLASAS